jgi:hypothetical protein
MLEKRFAFDLEVFVVARRLGYQPPPRRAGEVHLPA